MNSLRKFPGPNFDSNLVRIRLRRTLTVRFNFCFKNSIKISVTLSIPDNTINRVANEKKVQIDLNGKPFQ